MKNSSKPGDRYVFPAVFETCDDGGYLITFPDLPGIVTEGNDLQEALYMARDALELHLFCLEHVGELIPVASEPGLIDVPPGAFISLVDVWMPPVREEMQNRSVKKTLTIPRWLNEVAEQRQVNFSQILQAALKQYLNVNEPNFLKK